jgi:hypothetical protein
MSETGFLRLATDFSERSENFKQVVFYPKCCPRFWRPLESIRKQKAHKLRILAESIRARYAPENTTTKSFVR